MLTPALEKLILCGKASFNTFVVGASEKSVLFVDNDRFIIITGLTYFPSINNQDCITDADNLKNILNRNTQLKIFSEKSLNTFMFRNPLNLSEIKYQGLDLIYLTPGAPIKLDTYLIHDNSVSFTFSYAGIVNDLNRSITPAKSVGYPGPVDYGKAGQANAQNVRLIGQTAGTVNPGYIYSGGPFIPRLTANGVNELVWPVDSNTIYKHLNNAFSYPLLLVDYVEIKGNPTNIEATF